MRSHLSRVVVVVVVVDIDAQAASDSTASDTWWVGVRRLAVANVPNNFQKHRSSSVLVLSVRWKLPRILKKRTADWIEMPFGMESGSKECIRWGGSRPPRRKRQFCWGLMVRRNPTQRKTAALAVQKRLNRWKCLGSEWGWPAESCIRLACTLRPPDKSSSSSLGDYYSAPTTQCRPPVHCGVIQIQLRC